MEEKNHEIEDLTEIVISIKDFMVANMVTKAELVSVEEKLGSKIDGLGRRMDTEVDNRAQIETRVHKLEEAVFPA